MKKNVLALLSMLLSISVAQSAFSWSLNPFTWIKRDHSKEYKQELEKQISILENQYAHLVLLSNSVELNPESENFVKQLESLQSKLISFIKEHHKPEMVEVQKFQDIDRIYLEYPCIAFKKKLSDGIVDLGKALKRYADYVKENQDNKLLEGAKSLYISLAIFEELISCSKEFVEEALEFSNRCSEQNNRLTDVRGLVDNGSTSKG